MFVLFCEMPQAKEASSSAVKPFIRHCRCDAPPSNLNPQSPWMNPPPRCNIEAPTHTQKARLPLSIKKHKTTTTCNWHSCASIVRLLVDIDTCVKFCNQKEQSEVQMSSGFVCTKYFVTTFRVLSPCWKYLEYRLEFAIVSWCVSGDGVCVPCSDVQVRLNIRLDPRCTLNIVWSLIVLNHIPPKHNDGQLFKVKRMQDSNHVGAVWGGLATFISFIFSW